MGLKPLIAGMSQGGGSVATATLDGTLVTNAQTLSIAQIGQVRTNLREWTQYLAADLVKTADTALVTVFTQALAVGLYRFSGIYNLNLNTPTPSTTPGGAQFEFAFTGTTTKAFSSVKLYTTNDLVGGGLTAFPVSWGGSNTSKAIGSSFGPASNLYIHQAKLEGTLVVTTAGTFTVKAAQSISTNPLSATTFFAGSQITLIGMP